MNAAEQATNLELASKIATVVNLFKADFPDARVDLKPWANDPDTRELVDPNSIDISFNFPGRSRLFQSRCILILIRFHRDTLSNAHRAVGMEVAGFDHQGKQWWLSTIGDWNFEGATQPTPEVSHQLKHFCQQVLQIFNHGDKSNTQ
ncbi:MAG: hypothetical protein KME16_24920 [Scytolyngbya sp. HA4215-MV1]|nr:hypothetical protein [Scytolyngbya sp. HA4215-MV1]